MKAVYIGRFQPLHIGHYKVIEKYKEEYDEFEIVVGSADKSRTEENPLNCKERKDILEGCFADIQIYCIEDEEKNEEGNKKWIQKIKAETKADIIISRNDLIESIVEQEENLKLVKQPLYEPEIYSATEVRRRIRSGEEWRYLTPECSHNDLQDFIEVIKEAGTDYSFEPGWERENAFYDTAEE